MNAGLAIGASVAVGGFHARYELEVRPGEVLAVLGPNGAGKSTLLRAIAGLAPLERGTLELGGRLAEEAPGGVRLGARERQLGVVFQEYVLFGHLSSLDNVAFGLRARGIGRREARRVAAEWLERFGIHDLAARRPAQLSGGQAQKVALARALATSPRVLLLDEPLSALDVEARSEVRAELRRVLAEFEGAALVVTHDPADAAALADRIAIVERGAITQLSTPESIAAGPASAYVAALVGRTGFEVELREPGVATHSDLGEIRGHLVGQAGAPGEAHGPAGPGERLFASIRADRLELVLPGTEDARAPAAEARLLAPNSWHAEVLRLERDLGFVTATLLVGEERTTTRLTARLPLDTGSRIPGGLHECQSVIVHLPPAHVAFAATR
ncbi:ABC transporter ATP-binding protein [Pseudoclavibacter sp. AY1F1]|uniref:ABC transporter ATP-binding protein n=1 Tax=Pseudoclavibacter sp. AY1F1 TaxID=2080583 RepID=UPI000CE8EE95|nr:ABC transporter ATP-binding protein [Pseudoclavibacter sp. AY1F1]PPF44903.1 ABC transporter ATP-binding protein [Pseudoclavibacter sp. AY1F1]